MMEGVSNILLPRVSTNNNQNKQERNSMCRFFPYLIQEMRYQTLVYHAKFIQEPREQAFRGCASLVLIHSPKDISEERKTIITKSSENFSQILLKMGAFCYEMKFT
jgi:hypothetical protein